MLFVVREMRPEVRSGWSGASVSTSKNSPSAYIVRGHFEPATEREYLSKLTDIGIHVEPGLDSGRRSRDHVRKARVAVPLDIIIGIAIKSEVKTGGGLRERLSTRGNIVIEIEVAESRREARTKRILKRGT